MSADRMERLLLALPDARLPADLIPWLMAGIEAYQCGQDLEAALQLPDRQTHRDDLLRMLINLTPGDSERARCLFALDVLAGTEHPEPTARQIIEKLRRLSVRLPESVRALQYILKKARVQKNADLFHTWLNR